MRILIVAASEPVCLVLGETVRRCGWEPVLAASAGEVPFGDAWSVVAVECCERQPGGPELLRRFGQELPKVRRIALHCCGVVEQDGLRSYLPWPYSPAALAAILRSGRPDSN